MPDTVESRPSIAGDLRGATVLVTGGATGIGAALVRGFAAVGARVAIHFNTGASAADALVEELGAAGVQAGSFGADLTRPGSAETLLAAVESAIGPPAVLVNNAGSLIRRVPLDEMDDEYFEAVIRANLYSTVMCSRAVVPRMRGRGTGRIINLSSLAARTGGAGGATLYAAAKAGVSAFTRGLAKELAPDGIRVNAISPGLIQTAFHTRFSTPEAFAGMLQAIPLGRAAEPQEVVGTALYLASDDLSSYVTGQVIEVNGGVYSP